ncbi:(2,3-dihydroxybenzoyl)adenylate synthase [Photorhabdus sp. SF281]|uniref:(2,3-dihydroxybenzoyl)adenylate synthase n=1 Tax=Photorhabdus sp. SF281 TaxID=3459527 RepID=UPI0040450658
MIDVNLYNSDNLWPEKFCKLYRSHNCWLDKNLNQILDQVINQYSNSIAIESDDLKITYQHLGRERNRYSNVLHKMGIKKGDRIVIQLPNIPELIILLFACFKIGAIPVLCLPAHREYELKYISSLSDAVLYIGADFYDGYDHQSLADCFCSINSYRNKALIVGKSLKYPILTDVLMDTSESFDISYRVSGSSLALLQLSGGSTGLPKLIPRTHNDYLYSVLQSNKVCGITNNDRYLASLPILHNFILSSPGVLGVLSAGGTIVLKKNLNANILFSVIKEKKITFTSLVPAVLQIWLHYSKISSIDLSSLRFIQIGGAKLLPEIAKQVYTILSTRLQQVFGMGEGLVCYTRLSDPIDTILETQGRPMSEFDEVILVDEFGNPVSDGQKGSILVRGPYTIRKYFGSSDDCNHSFTENGFYKTGDTAIKTKEGNFIFCGREKDVVNRGGEKIIAQEIEQLALLHETINDCALVGYPDKYLGEKSCLFVVCGNMKTSEMEVLKFLNSFSISKYKIPDKVMFVDNLPKTAINKTNKNLLMKYVVY